MAVKVRRRGRRKGSPTAWKETIRNAMLPEESTHGVSYGTPAERRRDAIKGAKELYARKAKRARLDALFPSSREPTSADFHAAKQDVYDEAEYLRRNDGGMASKTRRF